MPARKPATRDAFDVVSDSIHEASEVMKAMASETRLKILCALSEGGEMPVGQLADLTEQSHSAVSQHLAKLRAANLVEFAPRRADDLLSLQRRRWPASINTLCDYYR